MRHHVAKPNALRRKIACLLMAIFLSGCAHRVAVTAWKPAAIDVGGLENLALLEFSGPQGPRVAAALESRLWDNGFYAVVDHHDSRTIRWASATDGGGRVFSLDDLQAARSAGIDGMLYGKVLEYKCEDLPMPTEDRFALSSLARNRTKEKTDVHPAAAGKVRREAVVTVEFRLVDVQSGALRVSRQIRHTASVLVNGREAPGQAPADLLHTLTCRCVDEFICDLAPHKVTEPMRLASPVLFEGGFTLVQNGNEFAIRNRWDEAIAAWEQAIAAHPENDAALFNLALAHAHRQQFSRAETYAIRARNVQQKVEYEEGLQWIRQQASAYDQTLQQRRDVTTFSLSDDGPSWSPGLVAPNRPTRRQHDN
ncbi:MAG: tetratricopeptide repeat protein [Planctomycetaceae bacterium]|nr:tetratricopeptide repeat protein [Planctomycetaceae bacterium]